jgi:ubiquinone/menaquinone biosynthesis C-methylase UbiE
MPENYKQKVTNFFNSRTSYDSEGLGHPENANRLLNFVLVRSGQTILDLATGTGLVAIPAAKTVAPTGSVIGVDLSIEMLAQARAKIEAENINNLEIIEADIESIDFNDARFDLIFCCSALVFISDIPALVDKCYRWLKPGGCFAFTSSSKGAHLSEVKVRVCKDVLGIDLPHIIRPLWTSEKCLKLLQKYGFQNIEIEKHLFRREKIHANYSSTQIEKDFYPRGNPLLDLSEAQKVLLQTEYTKAVDRSIAERGEWQESINLYVKAWK